MIHLTKPLKAKYTGPDDYLPENIPRDKWLPVIGYEIRRIPKNIKGETKEVEEPFFLFIDTVGKIKAVAAFNFSTLIDDKAILDANQVCQLLQNVVSLLKVLSEKMSKFSDKLSNEKD